ncbi:MAG: nucleoside kinase [Lachnospiraceae bacterium]|nr:nucleoside kinase [Lachnospiraceae bacterium]MEE1014992.1 nucleoside kinase [Lachnospiraceae bacterium]
MKKVTLGNIVKEYETGTSYEQIIKENYPEKAEQMILVKIDGKLEELAKKVKRDCVLEPVTFSDNPGYNSYRRSTTFLMLKAIYDLYTREEIGKVRVEFSAGAGYFCTLDGNLKTDEKFTGKVEARMKEYVAEAIPIKKEVVNTQEAISRFAEYGMSDKAALFRYRRASKVNIYSIGGFQDYYYGYMVPNTSYLKWFALAPFEDGFILQFPKKEEPTVVPPAAFSKKVFDVLRKSEEWGKMLELSTVGELNNIVSKGDLSEMILVQEAIQEKQIGDIAGMIAANPSKRIIMIAGPSSSGKTTFSHRLSVQLRAHGLKPHPIACDNYFVERENTPKDADGKYNFECLGALDTKLFNDHMNKLLAGETVEIPEFNFITGKKEYKGKQILTLGEEDVLVIEGIHCLNDAMSYNLPAESKFKIYISALTMLNIDEHNRIPTTDGRLIRRMVRDARTRGSSAKNTIDMWPSVRRGEEENIFPYQESADVVFNSALIYELAVLKQYAEPLLFGIDPSEPEYVEAKRLLKFLDYFVGVDSNLIPNNSILREFIGGSCFRV